MDNPSFVVSTIKVAEDGRGWVVRGYNILDEGIAVALVPWQKFENVERVNMAEERLGSLKVEGRGRVTFGARGHEIVTVRFGK